MATTEKLAGDIWSLISVAQLKLTADTGVGTNVWYVDKDHVGLNNGSKADPFTTIAAAITAADPDSTSIIFIQASGGGGYLGTYQESVTVNKSIVFVALGDIWWGPVGGAFGWQKVACRLSGPIQQFGMIGLTSWAGTVGTSDDGDTFGLIANEILSSGSSVWSQVNELYYMNNTVLGSTVILAGTAFFQLVPFALNSVGVGRWLVHDNLFFQGGASDVSTPDNTNAPFSPQLTAIQNSFGGGLRVSGGKLIDIYNNTFIHESTTQAKFDAAIPISGFSFDATNFTVGAIANVKIGMVVYFKSGAMNQTRAVITNVVSNTITVDVDVQAAGLVAGDSVWCDYEQGDFIDNNVSILFGGTVSNVQLGGSIEPVRILENSFDIRNTETVEPYDFSIIEAKAPAFGSYHLSAKANKIKIGATVHNNRSYTMSDPSFTNLLEVIDSHVHRDATLQTILGKDDSRFRPIDYGGAVTIDSVNGVAGTNYPVGTKSTPSNNITDAKAIADSNGLQAYEIRGAIILNATHDDWSFVGISGHDSDTVNLNSQSTNNTVFRNIKLTGTANGDITAFACDIDSMIDLDGEFHGCGFEGTCVLKTGSSSALNDCYSDAPGASTPVINMNAGNSSSLGVRGYKGGIEIRNLDQAGDNLSIDILAGNIILAASCTAGTAALRGIAEFTNNSSGLTLSTEALINLSNISDYVWDELLVGHVIAGSTGEAVGKIDTVTNVVDAVWDEALVGHAGVGTAGKAISDIEVDTNDVQTKLPTNNIMGSSDKADHDGDLALPQTANIVDAVWDELLTGHLTPGTTGKALQDAGATADPNVIADAVWDEILSGHTTAGSAGEILELNRKGLFNRMLHDTDGKIKLYADGGSTVILESTPKNKSGATLLPGDHNDFTPIERTEFTTP